MRGILTSIALAAVLALASAGNARAACGVGGHIWDGHDSMGAKIAASITNLFTFGGISTTFEIVGCTEENNLLKKIFAYSSHNMDHLAVEMARGEGEHLDALAHLLEIRKKDRAHFRVVMRENFETLVSHDRVTTDELVAALGRVMAADETLSVYVQS